MSRFAKWGLSLAFLFGLGSAVVAADPPKVPAPAAQPPAKTLTIEQLGQLLQDAGLAATPQKDAQGAVRSYSVRLTFNKDWSATFTFSLSNNASYVWVDVGLTSITNPGRIPPDVLMQLLKRNASTGSMAFYIDSANMLSMHMILSVDGMTPSDLKADVEYIESQMVATANLWTQSALGQTPPPPTAPPEKKG